MQVFFFKKYSYDNCNLYLSIIELQLLQKAQLNKF